jgi:nucleoside-diphosphate-sugar epimerase
MQISQSLKNKRMNNVLLFGGNGFIGRTFVKLYHSQFNITIVDQYSSEGELPANVSLILGDVSDKYFVDEISVDFDCVINFVYNRIDLKMNFKIIDNIISACLKSKIKKLIHLSTISVYDPYTKGALDEKSKYSRIFDPYSKIKQKQEDRLNTFFNKYQCCEISILQPTIVYGEGGNWSNHAIKETQRKKLFLPNKGKNVCNIVHVNEVCKAVFLIASKKNWIKTIDRFLISGRDYITWEEFYKMHAKKNKLETSYSVHELKSKSSYHNKFFKNIFYKTLFSKFGYYMTLLLSKYILRRRTKNEKEFIDSNSAFVPIGMNRLVHSSRFIVNSDKFYSKFH